MYSTTAYIYQQIQRILLIDTSGVGDVFDRRWEPVYTKNLKINKGVDNVILFEFINQDQKPVNIAGSSFVFRVVNQAGDELLITKPMDSSSRNFAGRMTRFLSSSRGVCVPRNNLITSYPDVDTVWSCSPSYSTLLHTNPL